MSALDDLVGLLDLEVLEVNLFRGESLDPDRVRLYGGEVLAQALMAAGRTVDGERRVHSMHAYFLKLGDPSRQRGDLRHQCGDQRILLLVREARKNGARRHEPNDSDSSQPRQTLDLP